MSNVALDGNVTDQNGAAVPGALVYVYDKPGTLASVYDSMGQLVTNPVTAGEDGYWQAFVPTDLVYTLRYYWGGRERRVEANIIAGTPPLGVNTDANVRANLAASAGAGLVGFSYLGTYGAGSVGALLKGGAVNVKAAPFNAAGDGATSDTVAINNAIKSLLPGQALYFPAGTYLIDSSDLQTVTGIGTVQTVPIPIGCNVYMEGGAWVKRAPLHTTSGPYFFTVLGDNILQVNIDGDQYPTSGGMLGTWRGGDGYGVYALGASNVTLRNCKFKNLTFGIQVQAASKWRVIGCDFYRIKQSGGLFIATSAGPVRELVISNNTVESMGDTAFACISFSPGYEISGVNITENTIRDTQYLTQGFALDIEGGFAFGLQFGNRISGNTIIQSVASTFGQGGITMNLYSQDSEVSNNVLISGNFALGDIGVSVAGTRRVKVDGNTISGFRGAAVYADGAESPLIRSNSIYNCGDGSAIQYSTIVLAYQLGTTDPVVADNDIECATNYNRGGTSAAAILARRFNATTVTNAVIQNNRIRNPIGGGISTFGFAGLLIGRVVIDGNTIVGDGSSTVFGASPIFAQYNAGLTIKGNTILEAKLGVDLTGSANVEFTGNTIENIVTNPTLASWVDATNVSTAQIERNHFSTAVTTKIVTTSATGLTLRRNHGYWTEKWGTSSAIATGGTIAHGLDATPTSVSLVAQGTTLAKVAATANATNITVTHDSGGSTSFFWEARA